jgi:GT2 family glycosyltransferase
VAIKEDAVVPLSRIIRKAAGNSFACAAIPRDVWTRLGGLDEARFPRQFNDAHFFLKALDAGLWHLYLGTETAFHQPGASGRAPTEDARALRRSLSALFSHMHRYEGLNPGIQKLGPKVPFASRSIQLSFSMVRAAAAPVRRWPGLQSAIVDRMLLTRELYSAVRG